MGKENERVDLVDDNGQIVERNVPKIDIDKFPELHLQIAIGIIFDSKGNILVEKRALTKKYEPGKIDHVCGAIESGETPEEATARESVEETGILPTNLKIIAQGLNVYGRYKYILVGDAGENPTFTTSPESEWVAFMSNEELRAKEKSGELIFVKDFFENNELALKERDF